MNNAQVDGVRGHCFLEHQVAAVTQQADSARRAAFHDAITSLPNRVLFNGRLEHEFSQAIGQRGKSQALRSPNSAGEALCAEPNRVASLVERIV